LPVKKINALSPICEWEAGLSLAFEGKSSMFAWEQKSLVEWECIQTAPHTHTHKVQEF
jgi:hypothetical protein